MAPWKSTVEDVLFEWSRHRNLSTDSKVTTTLHVFILIQYVKGLIGNILGSYRLQALCTTEKVKHHHRKSALITLMDTSFFMLQLQVNK